jgi:hypothetical protein
MKLFTIGDSISQGFMSRAAARTDLSYSTLLANKLGLTPGADYHYPDWQVGGLPFNIEVILRELTRRYGADIGGIEWLGVLPAIAGELDKVEDYYERGAGAADRPYPGGVPFFHNVAVSGFSVADAWLMTPALCKQVLGGRRRSNDPLQGPDHDGYRTALKVLNPSLNADYDNYSQLSWLHHHATTGEGVENLVLWLGAVNALNSVVTLKPWRRALAKRRQSSVRAGRASTTSTIPTSLSRRASPGKRGSTLP